MRKRRDVLKLFGIGSLLVGVIASLPKAAKAAAGAFRWKTGYKAPWWPQYSEGTVGNLDVEGLPVAKFFLNPTASSQRILALAPNGDESTPFNSVYIMASYGTGPAELQAWVAAGTPANPAACPARMPLSAIVAHPFDGANYAPADVGALQIFADDDMSPGSMPTAAMLSSTPKGSTAKQYVFLLDSQGNLGLKSTKTGNGGWLPGKNELPGSGVFHFFDRHTAPPAEPANMFSLYSANGRPVVKIAKSAAEQPVVLEQRGSWTPTLVGTTAAGTHGYAARAGHWRIQGGILTAWFTIVLNTLDRAASGHARIAGNDLPLPASDILKLGSAVAFSQIVNLKHQPGYTQFMGVVGANTKNIDLQESGDANAMASVPISNFTGNTVLAGQVSYPVD